MVSVIHTVIIDAHEGRLPTVLYRFMSRNIFKGSYQITEEEKLVEVVDELKDDLEHEIETVRHGVGEDNPELLYPKLFQKLKAKANDFKGESDYRQLTSVKSFLLGLVMLGRVRRHYTHAPWFKIATLSKMLGESGGVCLILSRDQVSLRGMNVVSCGMYDREH